MFDHHHHHADHHFLGGHHFHHSHHIHGGDLFHIGHHHSSGDFFASYHPHVSHPHVVIHTDHPYYHGRYLPQHCSTPVFRDQRGSLGAHRALTKAMVVFGVILLTTAVILLICGILNFAGAIARDTGVVGIPLLGIGGVVFLAGLLFTTISCCVLMHSTGIQKQMTNGVSAALNDQPATVAQFHSSSPPSWTSSEPPPYSSD